MDEMNCKTCMHSIANGDYYSCVERKTIVDHTYVCPDWKRKQIIYGKYAWVVDHTREGDS